MPSFFPLGPTFYMNSTSLHPEIYLSEMDTVVSNYNGNAQNTMTDEKQLKKYKGVIGKDQISTETETRFEIGFSFQIISGIENNDVLLQVGVANNDVIDLHPTMGKHQTAWTVSAAGCRSQYVCLIAESDGEILKSIPISEKKINSTVSKKIIYQLLPDENTVTVYINTFANKFIVFKNVEFTNALRLAVGVYNPKLAITSLTNIGTNHIEFDVSTLHRTVFMYADNNTISNIKFNDQFSQRNSRGNLVSYRGVLGDIQFNRKFFTGLPEYFEVKVEVNVMAYEIGAQDHLFEIGFTQRQFVDHGKSLRSLSNAWMICARKCSRNKNICLQTWQFGRMHKEEILMHSSFSKRLKEIIYLGFSLHLTTGEMMVFKRYPRKHIDTLSSVPFSKGVYPVFGVGSQRQVSIGLRMGESIPRFSFFGSHFKKPVCRL